MHNSKIYSILKYFDKYEQNRLRKYILSPYFNKNETINTLFEVFIDDINSEQSTELEKEDIWRIVQPDTSYNDVRFRKLCSDLLKLVEGFLAQQVYENNPLHQATYLIEAVGAKKMTKLYNTSMNSARRLSQRQLMKPASYFFYQYQIERNFFELKESTLDRSSKTNVEAIINNLDYFYLAEKLRYYSSILSRKNVVEHEYDLLFIDEIIQHLQKCNYDHVPLIAIHYQLYLTQVETENVEHYYKLKELLNKYASEIPFKEAYDSYSQAVNYCINKINKGQTTFLEEFLELNINLLDNGLLTDRGLTPWRFKNIVIVALRLDKFDWTEQFIHQYSQLIPEEYRDNAITFNLARLYWYQKKHEQVIELLATVDYEDVTYNLESKAMLLSTYYETDEIEPLYSLLESFRVFLNRHKDIPLKRRKYYQSLIRFTKKLTKILPGDRAAITKFKADLEKTNEVSADRWLKEKIAELE